MEPSLNPAYREAVFEFDPQASPTDFWVITACDPDGREADPSENQAADQRLGEELVSLGLDAFRVIGRSEDGSHVEPGWGVRCDEATALRIGQRYRQEAIFHFTEGRIDLVDSFSGSRAWVDAVTNRWRTPVEHRS